MVIIGGTWGFASVRNRSLATQIYSLMVNPIEASAFNEKMENEKNCDQTFLRDKIWPLVKANATIHDSYLCKRFPSSKPYPTRRTIPSCYVGNFEWCDDEVTVRHFLNHSLYDNFICPVECRPKDHKDWLYC